MTPVSWLKRDGFRLAVHGAGESAPWVVFQHGLCGASGQMAEAMAGVTGQSWRGLECPGHGASPLGGELSIPAFAQHVIALIETLPGPVVLGGISMGAAIATRIAVDRPDLLRGVVLVRPAWVTGDAPDNMSPNAEVGLLLQTLPRDQARAAFAAGDTARRLRDEAPDNLASLMGFFDRAPSDETALLLQAISASGPGLTEADLRAIRMPALVCGTAQDAIHPQSYAQALADLIPGARLVDLPPKASDKAAHLAALAAAMTHFLQET